MTSGQKKVVDILRKRDGLTFDEAKYSVECTIQQMEEVNYDPVESEEILMDHLGLEPDFLDDLLSFFG